MRELLVVGYKVSNVDITVVLPDQNVLSYLISRNQKVNGIFAHGITLNLPVNECIVKSEFKDEVS